MSAIKALRAMEKAESKGHGASEVLEAAWRHLGESDRRELAAIYAEREPGAREHELEFERIEARLEARSAQVEATRDYLTWLTTRLPAQYYTVAGVAEIAGLSPSTIRSNIQSGRLPSTHTLDGGVVLVEQADAVAFAAETRKPGRPQKSRRIG